MILKSPGSMMISFDSSFSSMVGWISHDFLLALVLSQVFQLSEELNDELLDDPPQLLSHELPTLDQLSFALLPALDQLSSVLDPALDQLDSLLEVSVPDVLESERHPGVGPALPGTVATLPGRR